MADVVKALRAYLLGQSAVTTVCGTRIFYENLPQDIALPAAVVSLGSYQPVRHLTGLAALANGNVRVDCYAATHAEAENLADQVRLKATEYRGTMGTLAVRGCFISGQRDFDDPPIDGSDAWRKGRSMDFSVWFVETTT